MSDKPYIKTTRDASTASVANLMFNPFSAITRSSIYMPQSVRQWGKTTFGSNAQDKTALLWQSGILLSTGLASVALIRALQAAADHRVLESKQPEDKYKQLVATSGQALIQDPGRSKKASEQQAQTLKHMAAWLPGAALIVGGLLGYTTVDDVADKIYNKKIKQRISQTNSKLNDAVIARAQLARDNVQGQQYKRVAELVKNASSDPDRPPTVSGLFNGLVKWFGGLPQGITKGIRSLEASMNLITAGVFAAGVVGAAAWSAKNNKARLRHNAAKKAVTQLIRARVQEQTLDSAPISQDIVARIEGTNKPKPIDRQLPELPAGLSGAPISIDI